MKEGNVLYIIQPALTVADLAHVIACGSDLDTGTIQVYNLPYALTSEEADELSYHMRSMRIGLSVSVNTDGATTIVCMQNPEL